MSKIIVENELMKNQKAAEILPPQASFECLQTAEGHSIFFSIGDDKVLYTIFEKAGQTTGWLATDISSELSVRHGDRKITAEKFAVTQVADHGNITIAVSVKAAGDDTSYLYILSGLPSSSGSDWMKQAGSRVWQARPYDDKSHPVATLDIAGLYLTPEQKSIADQQLICEVNIKGYLQNYTVNFSGTNAWQQLQTAENFEEVLSQKIGKAEIATSVGLYQLTKLEDGLTINFIPMESFFGPPTIIKLKAPEDATRIATLPVDDKNNTNLFVAAKESIYLFTPGEQHNFAKGEKIVENALLVGVRDFYAHQSPKETILWGLNQKGEVFSVKCARGSETDPQAWSTPIPILTGVERIASYVNQQTANSIIFAHTSGRSLVKLTQDPQTTIWQHSNILLPALDVDSVTEYTTYTSHIQLLGDDNIPIGNTKVLVTASSNCYVFINNVYYMLSPTVPIEVKTDRTGQVSIMQLTQTMGAVCYHLETEDKTVKVDVNPMTKLLDQIARVKTGDDLGKVQIPNADGSRQPLLGKDITKDQRDSTVAALQEFVKTSKELPQDGSVKTPDTPFVSEAVSAKSFAARPETIWGMSFEKGNWQFHSGGAAMEHFGLQIAPVSDTFALKTDTLQLSNIWDEAIETVAGDIWNWLKKAFDDVKRFFVMVVDDVYHFFLEIGEKLYRFVLDCVNSVIHAIEFIFNKLKVFIEELIKWLGVLFQWGDIVRTHNVLKNVIKQYVAYSIRRGGDIKKNIAEIFKNIEQRLDDWAGLGTLEGDISGISAKTKPVPGQHSPQANYGTTHLKNGLESASSNIPHAPDLNDKLKELLSLLEDAIEKEGAIFKNAFETLRKQVIEQFQQLSLGEIIKRLLAILGKILVGSAENIIGTALDVMLLIVEGMWKVFDAKLNIPILSWLYKDITGNDLSILDVVCLVMAIPATVVYKIMNKKKAPFPDNKTTQALISANSWEALHKVFNSDRNTDKAGALTGDALTIDEATENKDLKYTFIFTLRIVAALSTPIFVYVSAIKFEIGPKSKELNIIHACLYYINTAPNFAAGLISNSKQRWDKIVGEAIYAITSIQKFVDIFNYKAEIATAWGKTTKMVDGILGFAAMVPAIAPLGYDHSDKNIINALIRILRNLSRICSPMTSRETEDGQVIFAAKMGLISVWGVGQIAMIGFETPELT